MSDNVLSLAVSMQSNRGIYALLLGSGVSRSAGIPTGWEIVIDLIRRVAGAMRKDPDPDPVAWYKKRFNEDPKYTTIIDRLAKSPSERSQLLRGYFEPTGEDRERNVKVPTVAHRAIAQIVADGYVRVILTTNFDRLLETALEDQGVHPTVLASPDSIDGAMPLAHTRCCVLKVHGDYRDTRILNTVDEVAHYDERINGLLDQILDEYGLIVCGWSSEWDLALRQAISRSRSRRFTTYWAVRGEMTKEAKELSGLRKAQIIEIDSADAFFSELAEKEKSITELAGQKPLAAATAVVTLKRYLPDPKHRIQLHDLIVEERERLYRKLFSDEFSAQTEFNPEELRRRVGLYESTSEALRDLIIAGCYFGERDQSPLWIESIERVASLPGPEAGFPVWTDLRRYPALLLLYAGGLGALAAKRYGSLVDLLTKPKVRIADREYPILSRIDPTHILDARFVQMLPGMERRKTPMSQYLELLLRQSLSDAIPDDRMFVQIFDRFEYLLAAVYMDQIDRLQWAPAGCFAWRYELSDYSPAQLIALEIAEEKENWPPLKAGMFGGSLTRANEVFAALKEHTSRVAARLWFT